MRNQPETLHEYNIPRLHWWFLIASVLFVACLVIMVWVDYSPGYVSWLALHGDREWKRYQQEFYALEQKRLAADAQAAVIRANESGLGKLQTEVQTISRQLADKKAELDRRTTLFDERKVAAARVTRQFTMEKANRDQYRSAYEAALERHASNAEDPEVRDAKDKVEIQNQVVARLELERQDTDAKLAAAKADLEAMVGERDNLEHQAQRLLASVQLITKRLDILTNQLVQTVVNAPVLEFAASTYKVEQIVTETHQVDVNFATVPRVDRCITCHKGIDRKNPTPAEVDWRAKHKIPAIEWSKLPEPLRGHPRLDLFVGDTSPHPMSKYGCTTCHWGWDRETTFSRAGHTPDSDEKQPYTFDAATKQWVAAATDDDDKDDAAPVGKGPKPQTVVMTQKDAWQKNYQWEDQEYLVQPMRSPKYVEASCLKCHSGQTEITGAEQLDHGRRLIEQLGCWSCHKMRQLETWSLHRVAAGEDFTAICKFYDVNPDDVRRLNSLPPDVTLTVGQELNIPIRSLRKVGPSLYKVATKTTKPWTRKWLANPPAFRPNTYMPRFWGLDNNKDPDRDVVEQNALAEFLFTVSEQPKYPAPPVAGDAARGGKLVGQLGCFACHVINEKLMALKPPAQLAQFMDPWQYRRFRSQGPQLAGTGSKTTVEWLYAWLKDPKQYHPQTKMPNLRLADQEAADVATYLASLHNAKTDAESLAQIRPEKLDAVTLEYLQVTLPEKQAAEKLHHLDDLIELYFVDEETMKYYQEPARFAREEAQQRALQKEYEETFDDAVQHKADQLATRLRDIKKKMAAAKQQVSGLDQTAKENVYLGSKLVGRYGCYACHNIHGFETAKPIGTDLSEWGSKPVNKLDFGVLDLEPDRIAWLKQKLHAPRSFDTGRIGVTRSPQELLKMPRFNLTDQQIDQIVTVVTGMTDEKLTPAEPRQLTPAEFNIERGRWMVKELNCVGCHIIEGHGGALRATTETAGMEPPMLSGTATQLQQGQRTQPDWLFQFVKAPQTGEIRPWLKARMPTFGLSDGEANVLVRYFALEGRAQYPYQTPKVDTAPAHLAAGNQMFTQLKCALCHIVEGKALGKPLAEIPEEDLPRLAPNLSLAHQRLQRDWLINKWLPEPLAQVPGTRMPQFEYGPSLAPHVLDGNGKAQIEALVDYVLTLGAPGEPVPATAAPAKVNESGGKTSE